MKTYTYTIEERGGRLGLEPAAEQADSYTAAGWRDGEREALADGQLTVSSLRRLRDEAAEAGDLAQVALCDRALDGDATARAECVRVLRAAAAAGDE